MKRTRRNGGFRRASGEGDGQEDDLTRRVVGACGGCSGTSRVEG